MRRKLGKKAFLITAAAVMIVVGLIATWLVMTVVRTSDGEVPSYNIRGLDYSTNLEIEELRGDVYVYVLVNSDVDDIVLEVEHPADSAAIEQFFDGLDTFVPGEHELELTHTTLRIIVDGMAEE